MNTSFNALALFLLDLCGMDYASGTGDMRFVQVVGAHQLAFPCGSTVCFNPLTDGRVSVMVRVSQHPKGGQYTYEERTVSVKDARGLYARARKMGAVAAESARRAA